MLAAISSVGGGVEGLRRPRKRAIASTGSGQGALSGAWGFCKVVAESVDRRLRGSRG
jgi:hypothetical protein